MLEVIFSLLLSLLTPLLIFFVGLFFKIKKINRNIVFGYRTRMSLKNNITWQYANSYLGKIWSFYGGILLIISVVLCVYLYMSDGIIKDIYILCFIISQLIFVIVSIIFIEIKLNKKFNVDGNEKE
ncbi:SdpI family protein [Peptoniphilaceae bacterium SGI.131]